MQVTETLTEGLKRQFKVTLPAGSINDRMNERLRELSQTVKLPGFRPGKVPMPLLKKRYGASLMGEILDVAIKDSSRSALVERGIRPAAQPKIEVTAFAEGGDLEYTMALEVLPEVTPIDFSKLELEREKAEVGDAEIEKGIERLVSQTKNFVAVTAPRAAALGDEVLIDFAGRIGDVAFDGGTAADFALELGSGRFIPGFEDQVVGANAGETRDVAVTFPEGYQAANLAGKEAVFTVTVKEIREATPPTVDDEFAKGFGVENLDALRQAVRDQMERDFSGTARMKLKRKLLDILNEQHAFPLPEGMVEDEFKAIWQQVQQALAAGETDDEMAGKSDDERQAEYRTIAERRVRLGLVLAEVGRQNNLQVTEDELRRAAFEEARRYPGRERMVLEYFRNEPGAMDTLRAPILEEKVVDFIIEIAKVTERPVTAEQLFADPDDATAAEQPKPKAAPKKRAAKKSTSEAEAG